ncbi:helix-turn-helix domain-containing protein [Oerskovia sp. NPDC057915]|uniref:helix-turn-helix domain-containing protein n=1 Tax=Oerskovia sp. NPDC057915 TaxID=3346280 RepID=UPI0036DECD12
MSSSVPPRPTAGVRETAPEPDGEARHVAQPSAWRGSFLLTTRRYTTLTERSWRDATHADDELVWSDGGVLRVSADGGHWTVPAHLGVWIPAGTVHTLHVSADSTVLGTYFRHDAAPHLPRAVVAVDLHPAARELLHYNAATVMPDEQRQRLQRVLVDTLHPVSTAQVDLRMPVSPRLLVVAQAIVDDPADDLSTERWAERVGTSPRRLSRDFVAETGSSLTQWRINARVRASLVLLGSGVPVTAVARRLGYASPSTFIGHFRSLVGQTPGAYFRSERP